ncbi:hypothetical protein TRIATDRAFT_29967 [Trichoderma atroviride IMI 206040]|uniref:Secreted protein n=1 Tax=Hypocrea atroviridis (strain ATCC 20476 / IMI 206040) TaxID=452589 RepID=G9P519_HYPAI|nr:uncharacterized protein TRIATDRAFT_29967 [Trichoderma atroviride IMI 206040]EHK41259.1 hypothetical protein TRIATDRAFT_29967 [Trichoderma atroviride IMI 206040]
MGFRPCRTLFIAARPPFLASALQLLLQMPPASPFTASPFDLVINPGQRANSPVRPWLHPTFGRARLRTKTPDEKATHRCGSHWKHGQPDPALKVPAWSAVALTSHLMLRPTG